MHIIMEQVSGGELFEHIKTYELEENEIAIVHQLRAGEGCSIALKENKRRAAQTLVFK